MSNAKRYKGCTIRKDKRLAIYLRDNFRCVYCVTDLRSVHPNDITLDHIVPAIDGGTHAETNLITACRSCNCSRQDTPVTRFASPEALKQIRRNTRRSLTKYRTMAKALISGKTGQGID